MHCWSIRRNRRVEASLQPCRPATCTAIRARLLAPLASDGLTRRPFLVGKSIIRSQHVEVGAAGTGGGGSWGFTPSSRGSGYGVQGGI